MVPIGNPLHCLTYSLLVLPPLLLTTYLFVSFPSPPEAPSRYPSLASLPSDCRSWKVYPEDFYDGGAYAELPHGRVRYWLLGPEKGKKVVLVHGLSIPAMIWQNVAPQLAARGYRVLLYDLYGRGYSDAPQTTYDSTLYVTQLALLMQYIKWEKARIVGVSMGGAIAAAFTASFPQLVEDRVVLIASAGLIETSDLSRTAKFMSSPFLHTITFSLPVRKYLQRRLTAAETQSTSDVSPVQEIVRLQSAHLPGYNAAISSSMRDGPIRGQAAAFASEVFNGRRVLLVHGTNDRTVPYKYATRIQRLLPPGAQSELVTIEGAGHDLTVSHPGVVVDRIVGFFEAK